MSPKDDEGQEWHIEPTLKHELGHLVMDGETPVAIVPRESRAQQIVADHRDAQQLREALAQAKSEMADCLMARTQAMVEKLEAENRVRVLEEALRQTTLAFHVVCNHPDRFPCPMERCKVNHALLSSPVPGSKEAEDGRL